MRSPRKLKRWKISFVKSNKNKLLVVENHEKEECQRSWTNNKFRCQTKVLHDLNLYRLHIKVISIDYIYFLYLS